jgi:hypothetical protein
LTKLTTALLATLLSTTAAFAPPQNTVTSRQCTVLEMLEELEDTFDAAEKMGRGAAKVRLFSFLQLRECGFLILREKQRLQVSISYYKFQFVCNEWEKMVHSERAERFFGTPKTGRSRKVF